MSELIQRNDNRATIRWKLLTGASAMALTAYVYSAGIARAEDAGQPEFWIELGGEFSQLQDAQETFNPPIMDGRPSIFYPSQKFEKPPGYGFDEYGALAFRPDDSNWVFSASIRYGRSGARRLVQQQTNPQHLKYFASAPEIGSPVAQRFEETKARTSEKFDILDFTAGRDVGLGIFGKDATSVVSAGVRFAQFQSKTNISLKSDPDWHFNLKYFSFVGTSISFGQAFHSNIASLTAQRSFHGVGPTLSWKASEPLAGNIQDGALILDWSANAALLFGRQRAKTHHQSTSRYFYKYGPILTHDVVLHTLPGFPVISDKTRSRDVTVPNVGGSIGLSWQLQNAKISLGYRADFFLNAIDGGIDTRKSENRGFFGPYASVSIGLGD